MNLLHTITLHNVSGIAIPVNERTIRDIVGVISEKEKCECLFLEVVFVDEDEIVRINKKYLNRDSVTDVISFSYVEEQANLASTVIDGTLYCCAQRISEQAGELNQDAESEFRRIVIHGILHLLGYEDATSEQKQEMRDMENLYLKQLGTVHEN